MAAKSDKQFGSMTSNGPNHEVPVCAQNFLHWCAMEKHSPKTRANGHNPTLAPIRVLEPFHLLARPSFLIATANGLQDPVHSGLFERKSMSEGSTATRVRAALTRA